MLDFWSIAQGRIIITRNYQDVAPLVSAHAKKGLAFPGVLFIATSVPQALSILPESSRPLSATPYVLDSGAGTPTP